MELIINDEKMKDFLKEVIIEMLQEKSNLFHEVILESLEEVALADAIIEGRKNDFVSEDRIFELLEG